jgi:putative lipoprotein (rSAM/lipoprotein system)
MKIFKRRITLLYNSVIAGFLALLGFTTSCEKDGSGGVVCMYGTPAAKFIIKGKVTSFESETPVPSIRVFLPGDTAKTDADGNYTLKSAGFPHDQTFNISFQDIDGTLNGQFENLDTTAVFKNPEYINGDGHWYKGESTKELNIRMKTKK